MSLAILYCRQRDREMSAAWPRGVGSVTERIKEQFSLRPCDHDHVIEVQLPLSSSRVVASLDKALYNNYCRLVASNKQQINWEEAKKINRNTWKLATPKWV